MYGTPTPSNSSCKASRWPIKARDNYKVFLNGVADAVDTGTLGNRARQALEQTGASLLALQSWIGPSTRTLPEPHRYPSQCRARQSVCEGASPASAGRESRQRAVDGARRFLRPQGARKYRKRRAEREAAGLDRSGRDGHHAGERGRLRGSVDQGTHRAPQPRGDPRREHRRRGFR